MFLNLDVNRVFTYIFITVNTLVFDISNALAPPDVTSDWMPIKAYDNPEVDISHGLNELPLKVEVQVKVFDRFLNKDMFFLATGSAQKGNDNNLPFGGVLYLYNSETIKILAPGPTNCTRPECTGFLVYLGKYICLLAAWIYVPSKQFPYQMMRIFRVS